MPIYVNNSQAIEFVKNADSLLESVGVFNVLRYRFVWRRPGSAFLCVSFGRRIFYFMGLHVK